MKVYIIGPADGPYKVGIACNPKKRLQELQVGSYQRLILHHVRECASRHEAAAIEAVAHAALGSRRLQGEWFACSLDDAQGVVCENRKLSSAGGLPYDQARWNEIYQTLLALARQVPPEKLALAAEAIGASELTPEAIATAATDNRFREKS